MRYHELLSQYIEQSELSLGELVLRLNKLDVDISRSYISKLKNGNKPPAPEKITQALAEITGGDPEALIAAAYMEKAPEAMKDSLREAEKFRFLFRLIRKLFESVEYFYDHEAVNDDLYEEIKDLGEILRKEYNHFIDSKRLEFDPEYAIKIAANLRYQYFPHQDLIKFGEEIIDFKKYIDDRGNAIRRYYDPALYTPEEMNQMKENSEQYSPNKEEHQPIVERLDHNAIISQIKPDVQFIMRTKEELSPENYKKFMELAKQARELFADDDEEE